MVEANLTPSPPIALPRLAPQGDGFLLKPNAASFMEGTSPNGEPRLAWARSTFGMGWHGPNAWNGQAAITIGGRTARDASLASAVSNEMATQNSTIATLLTNLTATAIGTGLTLSSKPRAAELGITEDEARALSHQIESQWAAWQSNPLEVDLSGRFDMTGLAAGFFRQWLLNGEAVATLEWQRFPGATTKTKVQLLDVAQLDRTITRYEPEDLRVLQGVVFNKVGRLVGYMLRTPPLGSWTAAPVATVVKAFTTWGRPRVIHVMLNDDPRAVRGLSPLIAALTPAQEGATLQEFTLGKAMIDASVTNVIESALPTAQAFDTLTVNDRESHIWNNLDGWLTAHDSFYGGAGGKARVTPQVGSVIHLLAGDKLVQHDSKAVSNTYDAFDKSIQRRAAKAAGSSVEDLTGDYSKTSFSASRLAMALPSLINDIRRKQVVERFYKAVFTAWLEEQWNLGAISLPKDAKSFYEARDAYCNASFLGKGPVSADPKKTREALVMGLEAGLVSLTDALAEDGKDLETHLETLAQERKLLQRYGLEHPLYATLTGKQPENAEVEPDDKPSSVKPERDTFVSSQPAPGRRRAKAAKAKRLDDVTVDELAEALESLR